MLGRFLNKIFGIRCPICRIKLEIKYRPFKSQEECWNEMLKHQPFGWVIDKADNKYFDISMIYHFTDIKSETKVITFGKLHT